MLEWMHPQTHPGTTQRIKRKESLRRLHSSDKETDHQSSHSPKYLGSCKKEVRYGRVGRIPPLKTCRKATRSRIWTWRLGPRHGPDAQGEDREAGRQLHSGTKKPFGFSVLGWASTLVRTRRHSKFSARIMWKSLNETNIPRLLVNYLTLNPTPGGCQGCVFNIRETDHRTPRIVRSRVRLPSSSSLLFVYNAEWFGFAAGEIDFTSSCLNLWEWPWSTLHYVKDEGKLDDNFHGAQQHRQHPQGVYQQELDQHPLLDHHLTHPKEFINKN